MSYNHKHAILNDQIWLESKVCLQAKQTTILHDYPVFHFCGVHILFSLMQLFYDAFRRTTSTISHYNREKKESPFIDMIIGKVRLDMGKMHHLGGIIIEMRWQIAPEVSVV